MGEKSPHPTKAAWAGWSPAREAGGNVLRSLFNQCICLSPCLLAQAGRNNPLLPYSLCTQPHEGTPSQPNLQFA